MWRKSISHCIKVVPYDDNRILGIQLTTDKNGFLFVCAHLSY